MVNPAFPLREITQLQRKEIVALAAQLENLGTDERLELLGGFDVARRKAILNSFSSGSANFIGSLVISRKFGFDTLPIRSP